MILEGLLGAALKSITSSCVSIVKHAVAECATKSLTTGISKVAKSGDAEQGGNNIIGVLLGGAAHSIAPTLSPNLSLGLKSGKK